mgnify:CR=1 FL=1
MKVSKELEQFLDFSGLKTSFLYSLRDWMKEDPDFVEHWLLWWNGHEGISRLYGDCSACLEMYAKSSAVRRTGFIRHGLMY